MPPKKSTLKELLAKIQQLEGQLVSKSSSEADTTLSQTVPSQTKSKKQKPLINPPPKFSNPWKCSEKENYADLHSSNWNDDCETAVRRRTAVFNSYAEGRTLKLEDVKEWRQFSKLKQIIPEIEAYTATLDKITSSPPKEMSALDQHFKLLNSPITLDLSKYC